MSTRTRYKQNTGSENVPKDQAKVNHIQKIYTNNVEKK